MEHEAGGVQPVRTPGKAASIDPSISKAWARARAGLRSEFGEEAFRSWINPLTLEAVRGNTAILSIKSRFLRDWVSSNYHPQILGHFNAELPAIEAVDLVARIAASGAGAPPGPDARGETRGDTRAEAAALEKEADSTPSLPLEPPLRRPGCGRTSRPTNASLATYSLRSPAAARCGNAGLQRGQPP